ncbi:hypothetical protein LguiA_000159 [Lonicera macranthoides]
MAATTIATMAMIKTPKSLNNPSISSNKPISTKLPISLLSLKNLPKPLTPSSSSTLAGTAIAGAIFSTLSSCDPAFAAQQIAQIAEADNRGTAILLPIIPAIGWVLYNILQPALNQINNMRSSKGAVVGLVGLGASGLLLAPHASAAASDIAMVAAADASGDNRGQLLLFVIAPAILWVLYNILQPALNQINKMRS